MNKPVWLLPLLLPLAGTAAAQDAGACPYLAADTGLTWEHRGGADSDFCRALRQDGSEAFGMTIAKEAPFKPKGGNRAERVNIDGREVTWYRTEIAGTQVQARETVVQLPDGRMAYMWVQAASPEQLNQVLQQTESMKFGTARLSSN
ncbi:hypothetical protein [Lysobacter solisilvae (ex Woo and Kim 2020)]|uniref:Uncharacterized protein n=1 Tax=Agrilutibacter terrestris TaxID=2865112 RepID=A0A7H0FVP8_9GAMM|nr:hypothetical protein [Lysobacter terrestris]QNP40114.1 hypothetical protein H8B22_11505 [Lysobacter terrestris]